MTASWYLSFLNHRYDSIRTSFGRYLRNLCPASGSGREAITLDPKYENLRWLMPYIKQRTGTTTNLRRLNEEICGDDVGIENEDCGEGIGMSA